MKRLIKRLLQVELDRGEELYERIEEIIDDESEMSSTTTERLLTCRTCQRAIKPEERLGDYCTLCVKVGAELKKAEFERMIILEQLKLRILESKSLDHVPGIGLIRQLVSIGSLQKIAKMERRILNAREGQALPAGRKSLPGNRHDQD